MPVRDVCKDLGDTWKALFMASLKRVLAIIKGMTTAAVGFVVLVLAVVFAYYYTLWPPACPTTLFPVSFSHSMQPHVKSLSPSNWKVLCLLIVALARGGHAPLEGML